MSTTKSTRATETMVKLTRAGGVFDYGTPRSRLLLRVLRALGQGRPVSPEQVDQIVAETGITRDDAQAFLSQVAERASDNRIMGILGLSLNETAHRFTVNGRQLFTWCALDTLFLPALLSQPASVESVSPVGATTIRLTISPQRVDAADPSGAVVSTVVVDPDVSATSSVEAIWSTFCHHIFFFGTREEAEGWATERDNSNAIEILSLDDAFELGRRLSGTLLAQAGEV
jgi:alkylmercury lyase